MDRRRQMWAQKSKARHTRVLEAALTLAEEKGYRDFTRQEVAERAAVAVGSVNFAFGSMNALRCAVMQEAVNRALAPLVAQGLAANDPIAQGAPYGLKKLAASALV